MFRKVALYLLVFLCKFSVISIGMEEAYLRNNSYKIRKGCENHLEISIGWWGIDSYLADNDKLREKIEGEFNISIVGRNVNWNNWHEKYKYWAEAGKLPDVFGHNIVNTPLYLKWISQGIIEPIPEDLNQYPNVERIMNINEVKVLRQKDGKHYLIPRLKQYEDYKTALARGMYVRKDWMKEHGFNRPESYDEFYRMLNFFVNEDPDGNNIDDTVGITLRNKQYLMTLFLPSSPNTVNESWVKEDNRWIPGWTSKDFLIGLKQVHQLYQDGLLDPEMSVLRDLEGQEKFAFGKAGVYIAQITPHSTASLKKSWEKYNNKPFEEAVGILHIWPNKNGVEYRFNEKPFWSSTYFKGGISREKMDRILKLYNYLLSEEGIDLLLYGIEGEDYIYKDGQKILTWEKDSAGNLINLSTKYKSLGLFLGLPSWYEFTAYENNKVNRLTFSEEGLKMSLENLNWIMNNTIPAPRNYNIDLLVEANKDSTKLQIDSLVKVILKGSDPIDGWKDVLKSHEKRGLSEAIDEVNVIAGGLDY